MSTSTSWLRCLVAGLSPHRMESDSRSVHVKFAADKQAMGQAVFSVLRLFSVTNIPLMYTLIFYSSATETTIFNEKTRNVYDNVTLSRVCANIVVVEKQ